MTQDHASSGERDGERAIDRGVRYPNTHYTPLQAPRIDQYGVPGTPNSPPSRYPDTIYATLHILPGGGGMLTSTDPKRYLIINFSNPIRLLQFQKPRQLTNHPREKYYLQNSPHSILQKASLAKHNK